MNLLVTRQARFAGVALVIMVAAGSLVSRTRAQALAKVSQEKDQEKPEAREQEKKDKPKKKAQGLPLKPDRTIEFTTDEGTWVSLDVSPDGKTILFELLGDLYTVPIERRRGEGDHHRAGVRQPAELLARRQDDRVRQRPRRCREPVGRRRGRVRSQAADQGQAEPVRLAVVDARRRLRARLATAAAPLGCVRAVDVPRPRRLRRPGHQGQAQARRQAG